MLEPRSLKFWPIYWDPHISKRPSDLKQNGTQEKTLFSDTVFNTLSDDVFHFVANVSFKNHRSFWLAVKKFQPVRRWLYKLTLATKQTTPCERVLKIVPKKGVFFVYHLVWGHLGVLKDVGPIDAFRDECIVVHKLKWYNLVVVCRTIT